MYGKFSVGEYIIYVNGDNYELGRIKELRKDGAFVAYHSGEISAKTPYSHMHKLINGYTIESTSLCGDFLINNYNEIYHDRRARGNSGSH